MYILPIVGVIFDYENAYVLFKSLFLYIQLLYTFLHSVFLPFLRFPFCFAFSKHAATPCFAVYYTDIADLNLRFLNIAIWINSILHTPPSSDENTPFTLPTAHARSYRYRWWESFLTAHTTTTNGTPDPHSHRSTSRNWLNRLPAWDADASYSRSRQPLITQLEDERNKWKLLHSRPFKYLVLGLL